MLIVINNFAIHRYSMPPGKRSKTGQGRRSNKAIGPRKKHKQPAVLSASITTNVTSLEDPNPDSAISKAATSDIIVADVNVLICLVLSQRLCLMWLKGKLSPVLLSQRLYLMWLTWKLIQILASQMHAMSDASSSVVEEADELVS